MQAELDVHEMPRKSVRFAPEIDGVGCPAQVLPFQTSVSVSSGAPSASAAWLPVAAQNAEVGHETPFRLFICPLNGFGVDWIVQPEPFHRSARVIPALVAVP